MTKKYFLWADLLRIVAIFFVVVLHTSAGYLYQWQTLPLEQWWLANFLDSAARFAVPLFVMLSGALLLNKSESYPVFCQKRMMRILLPWLFWTGIYVIWSLTFRGIAVNNFSELLALTVQTFFGGFWFLAMLTGVYLLMPIWRVFVKRARHQDFYYLIGLWFICASVLPFVYALFNRQFFLHLPIALQYSGYFLLGYFLKQRRLKLPLKKWLIFITIGMIAVTVGGTYFWSVWQQKFVDVYYDFLAPAQVIGSSAIFLAFCSINKKQFFLKIKILKLPLIKQLAQATLGIYLLHIIILEILQRLNILPTIVSLPFLAISTYLISFAVINLIRRSALGRLVS